MCLSKNFNYFRIVPKQNKLVTLFGTFQYLFLYN